ncbi:Protein of unknown function [Octadecabacter temperatus]|uniref:Uncharacterized protein n=1 Tax=Octadecabacter temperatus TaxID=1458307 RepID=A0A0K0Y756_9RHOB|nr:glycosyltransferase family 87 protein [Octadecabacter temperatus]AKS46726.1 hypothetical protein OSB_21890 [Octadecabacter temperatus]SIO20068.1 Protein of unknown function [Octadecabacter temperatus]
MTETTLKPIIMTAFFCVLVAYGVFISSVGAVATQSADLFAMWIAGEFMQMGRVDQIYPAVGAYFDMTTPSDWWAHVSATDETARIFPYIYPPIWAKLASYLTTVTSFAAFDLAFLVIHQAALAATVFLATRMCGLRGMTQLAVFAMTYAALVLTTPIGLALAENQPQILVSFLIVFAFERAQFGHLRSAGAILAIAAAIKVYPLLFIVIFLGRRQWSAIVSFAAVGGALGLTSIALAGWPLHAEYLTLIQSLTHSVVVTNFSFSIDAYLAGTVFSDELVKVRQPRVVELDSGWAALGKSPLWVSISSFANLCALVLIAWVAAKRPHSALVLPVAAILLALLSPLSWAYTYLTAFVFFGILPLRLGVFGLGLTIIAAVFFHRALPMATFGNLDFGLTGGWLIAGSLIALFGAAFVWVIWQDREQDG